MKEKVEGIITELKKDIESVKTPQDIVDIKAKYIGKSGSTGNPKDMVFKR